MDDGNHDGLGTYWVPLPTARRLLTGQPHLDRFGGHWDERNWRNVPGPFYGADTDSLRLGRRDAPFHLAHDDDHGPLSGGEFVHRQPVGAAQTRDLLDGCALGHGGFATDGDDHWTVPAVRERWQERGRVRISHDAVFPAKLRRLADPVAAVSGGDPPAADPVGV